jgi:hypothetical protein
MVKVKCILKFNSGKSVMAETEAVSPQARSVVKYSGDLDALTAEQRGYLRDEVFAESLQREFEYMIAATGLKDAQVSMESSGEYDFWAE